MSKRLERNVDYLRVLSTANPKMCKCIVQAAHKDLVDALCECAQNVLYGTVPLTASQKRKLVRYKKHLRKLARSKKTSQKARKVVLQTGGFLPALLGPLATAVLAPIASKVLGKIIP